MTQKQSRPYNLRSGLVLYPAQQKAVEDLLTELAQNAPAPFILLADVTGQVISTRGGQNSTNAVALGSLVAGDLAASHEIARLTSQYQDNQMVLREGQSTHTFICEAGHHLALLVQISTETPLGWARMVIQKAARQLAEITAAPPPQDLAVETLPVEENLPDLFSDALDDLWQE
ncbi:MAG: roadblock/LC7 domain-containing protein [Anaerolineae bacterium]